MKCNPETNFFFPVRKKNQQKSPSLFQCNKYNFVRKAGTILELRSLLITFKFQILLDERAIAGTLFENLNQWNLYTESWLVEEYKSLFPSFMVFKSHFPTHFYSKFQCSKSAKNGNASSPFYRFSQSSLHHEA